MGETSRMRAGASTSMSESAPEATTTFSALSDFFSFFSFLSLAMVDDVCGVRMEVERCKFFSGLRELQCLLLSFSFFSKESSPIFRFDHVREASVIIHFLIGQGCGNIQ